MLLPTPPPQFLFILATDTFVVTTGDNKPWAEFSSFIHFFITYSFILSLYKLSLSQNAAITWGSLHAGALWSGSLYFMEKPFRVIIDIIKVVSIM